VRVSSFDLVLDARFCGPPDTANGGYVAGRLARGTRGPIEVTLRAPAPLGRRLRVSEKDGVRRLLDGQTELASARPVELDLEVPEPPGFAEAAAVAGRCRAFETHPFPRCFVCGPDRPEGDGLRIFPGWLPDRGLVAAAWVPGASLADESGAVRPEFLWGALDCPSAFPLLEPPEAQRLEPMVLGRLSAECVAPVAAGRRIVLTAWVISLEGRKGCAGAALHAESGELLARARATWISLAGSTANPVRSA